MKFESKFGIGDIVFLITDVDQKERIITQVSFRQNNWVLYEIACGCSSSWHYDFEISSDKNWKMT